MVGMWLMRGHIGAVFHAQSNGEVIFGITFGPFVNLYDILYHTIYHTLLYQRCQGTKGAKDAKV